MPTRIYTVVVEYQTDDDPPDWRRAGVWKGSAVGVEDARKYALDAYEDVRIDGWRARVVKCVVRRTAEEKLRRVVEKMERIAADESLDWEARYDRVFELHGGRFKPLLAGFGYGFAWHDPDTSYQEDVAAYLQAVREFMTQYFS